MAENSITNELTGSSIQTDHGGLEFGDLVTLLLDAVLLIYTGFRSYDYLTNTVPTGFEILALVGLWGLDIGAIAWSLVWMFASTSKYQNWTSMAFFVIDLLGVVLTSVTDSLMYGEKGSNLTTMLVGITSVAVPLVIVGNVIAGFIYHMTSPRTKAMRASREKDAEHKIKMQEIKNMERDLFHAEQYLLAKQEQLDKSVLLSIMKLDQDAVEKATRAKLRDQTGISAAAKVRDTSTAEASEDRLEALQARLKKMTEEIMPKTGDAHASLPAGKPESVTGQPTTQSEIPVFQSPASTFSFVAQIEHALGSHQIHKGDFCAASHNKNEPEKYSISIPTDTKYPGTVIGEVNVQELRLLMRGPVPIVFKDPAALVEPAVVAGNGHKPILSPI